MTRLLACLMMALILVVPAAGASAAELDHPVPNGWFYSQAGERPGHGFAITDDAGVAFWRDYSRLGGPATLGYPVSWRFVGADGFIYQATQAGLLQWRPDQEHAVLANAFDLLSQAQKDDWLARERAIPRPVADDGSGGNSDHAQAIRFGWLEDGPIRMHYFANPSPNTTGPWSTRQAVELFGLPTSRPERMGPFVVQRFQRGALQHWVEPVVGMPSPGTVVRVLVGDLLKETGLIPRPSALSQRAGSIGARVSPELLEALELLRDVPSGAPLYEEATERHLAIVWAPLSHEIAAMFSARHHVIAVNVRWHASDRRTIATLLSHELSHARDVYDPSFRWSEMACLQTELLAFNTQAAVWQEFHGPAGKAGQLSEVEYQENWVLRMLREDRAAFDQRIVEVYGEECAGLRR